MLDDAFLERVEASKRSWHEPSAQQKGIMRVRRWTGPGRHGLEIANGKAESRPHVAAVHDLDGLIPLGLVGITD